MEDLSYYEKIVRKHYNPTDEKFTKSEYEALIKTGNDLISLRELTRKTSLLGFDFVAQFYAGGELTLGFEDALQDSYMLLKRKRNLLAAARELGSLERYSYYIKRYLAKCLSDKEAILRRHNFELNFGHIVDFSKVEETIDSKLGVPQEKFLQDYENKKAIDEGMKKLTPRQQEIIKEKFGLENGLGRASNREVAKRLGVSKNDIIEVTNHAYQNFKKTKSIVRSREL